MLRNSKPLVAHIIDRMPPDGAERLVVDVLKNRSDNYQFVVLCLIEGGILVDELEEMGIPVIILGRKSRYDITLIYRLVEWLRQHKPLIVHTHLFTADSWGRLAAFIARIPGIFSTVHSVNSWKSPVHKFVDKSFSYFTTKIIACSEEVRNVLIKESISEKRVVTIANGVSLERIRENEPADLKKEFEVEDGVIKLIIIGRLHEAKGHLDLLPVISNLVRDKYNIHLMIVGDGELRGQIKERISGLGIEDHVTLTGFRKDVLSLVASIDIVLMPSKWEGLPMALLEAMALQKTVVATAVGGIPNVIKDNENGLLSPAANFSIFEEKLRTVIDDKEFRDRLSANAIETVINHFSAKTVSSMYESLYDNVKNTQDEGELFIQSIKGRDK